MIVSRLCKLCGHVEAVVHANAMILVPQCVEKRHYTRLQRGKTHLGILLWCWVVPKVERISKTIVTKGITLETIAFLFVCNSLFVGMPSLKSNCLLVNGDFST